MISIVAQPMFCAMLSSVGSTEPRRPTRPRSVTMAGAPVAAPNRGEAPSSDRPERRSRRRSPLAPARPIQPSSRSARPVSGPNRLMPRLPHRASWSMNPQRPRRLGGEGERRLVAAARRPRSVIVGVDVRRTSQAPYAGITRSGSVGRRTCAVVRTPPSQPTNEV